MMCSFEDTLIVGITGNNELQRKKITLRELEMMIMVVWMYDTKEWGSIYNIMSYFEESLFGSMMTKIYKVIKRDRSEEFVEDLEYLEDYFNNYVNPMYHRLLREGGYVDAI